jgi:hypothetical protein
MDVTQPSISSLMVPFSAAALLAQQEKHLTDSATGSLKEKLQVKRANIDHHVFGGGIARGNVVGFSCGRLSTGPPGGGAFRGQAGDELTVGRLVGLYSPALLYCRFSYAYLRIFDYQSCLLAFAPLGHRADRPLAVHVRPRQ